MPVLTILRLIATLCKLVYHVTDGDLWIFFLRVKTSKRETLLFSVFSG